MMNNIEMLLHDTPLHTIDEVASWLDRNGCDLYGIYSYKICYGSVFNRNMAALLQKRVLDSPLPVDFEMEGIVSFVSNCTFLDSPLFDMIIDQQNNLVSYNHDNNKAYQDTPDCTL